MKHKTSPTKLAQLLQPSLAYCFSLQPMAAYRPASCLSLQQLCKSCRTCFMFYCMFYFTCDRSFMTHEPFSSGRWSHYARSCTPTRRTPSVYARSVRLWVRIDAHCDYAATRAEARADSAMKRHWIQHSWRVLQVENGPTISRPNRQRIPSTATAYWRRIYAVWVKIPPPSFSYIFPKQLGLFSPNFKRLLYAPNYARLQTFIPLSPNVMKYAILSATTQRYSSGVATVTQ